MYCPNCGRPHDPIADFCVGCGTAVSARGKAAAPGPGTVSAGSDFFARAFTLGAQAPGNVIPPELAQRWNWGAFLLPIFWPLGNANNEIKVVALVAFVAGFFGAGLPVLALAIYLGISGGRIAARDRSWASIDDYIRTQRTWTVVGLIVFVVGLIVPLLIALVYFAATVLEFMSHASH